MSAKRFRHAFIDFIYYVVVEFMLSQEQNSLSSVPSHYRLPWSWVVWGCLAYLLLPNILFLNEVFRPLYAVPLSAALVAAAVVMGVQVHRRRPVVVCSSYDLAALGAVVLLVFLLVEFCGFNGHMPQSYDHCYRNAIYGSLVHSPWPVFSDLGDCFIYYHAFWLPPAYLAKWMEGVVSPEILLYDWVLLGFFLFSLIAFARLKRYVLVFFVFVFLLGNITEIILSAYEVNNMIAAKWPNMAHHIDPYSTLLYAGRQDMRFMSVWGGTISICYNAGIPALVMMGLIASGTLPLRYWFFPVSMISSMNPCLLVGLIPLIIVAFAARPSEIRAVIFNAFFWVCIILFIACLVYYSGQNQGAEFYWIWDKPSSGTAFARPWSKVTRVLSMTLSIVVPAFVLLRGRLRKNQWFIAVIATSTLLPLVWYGHSDNILVEKAAFSFYVVFALLLTIQWKHSRCIGRWVISVFVLFSALHTIGFIVKNQRFSEYSLNPEITKNHYRKDWGDSVNNMQGTYYYSNFFGNVKSETFQYSKPGESVLTRRFIQRP